LGLPVQSVESTTHTSVGRTATIVGVPRDGVLTETRQRDFIAGLGNDDRIEGRGGSNLICGKSGADRLVGYL
jgi:hypothetical protein